MFFFDLMDTIVISQMVVYCNTTRKVEWLHQSLTKKDFNCGMVHRAMDRHEKDDVITQYRVGSIRILITNIPMAQTTVMSSLILLFDPPSRCDDYVNMIGRSGKFGRKGVIILFIAEGDNIKKMRELEQFYTISIPELPANIADII